MSGAASRFPFPPFPRGWFRVADSADIVRARVKALRGFGQDLVAFRDEQGSPRVLDAHCPHLGAHLGVGGTIVEGTLQCPFHGWRFDARGACVAASGGRPLPSARLREWPARDWGGAVLAYHDPAGEAPRWEPPALPEESSPEWTRLRPANRWLIRSHPQEFEENGMDLVHFPFLHSQQTAAITSVEARADGPFFFHRTYQRYAIFGLARLFTKEVHGPLDITLVGPGCAINRAAVHAGVALRYTYLFFFTPVDGERVEMRSFLAMRRVGSRLLERALLAKAAREGARTIEQDIPIWENKRYRERPLVSDADGPILAFRRWFRQFDPEPALRAIPARSPAATADTPRSAAGTSGDA
jgi:phenylpropionate dioxygenase-like ring-hydroxylating dioxygenase large terminal subunit